MAVLRWPELLWWILQEPPTLSPQKAWTIQAAGALKRQLRSGAQFKLPKFSTDPKQGVAQEEIPLADVLCSKVLRVSSTNTSPDLANLLPGADAHDHSGHTLLRTVGRYTVAPGKPGAVWLRGSTPRLEI